jgi:NhaA family Na+:H+ antiporter
MNRKHSAFSPVDTAPASRGFATLERFLHLEAASGVVLLIAAALALFWANSPLGVSYHDLWRVPISIGAGSFVFSQSLHFWINDFLMTVFFLVVGMEIRREIHEGSLCDLRQAALPVIAALGGVIVPAVIFVAINQEPLFRRGWAIPTATDIAFAIGVLALLGSAVPRSVRVFLLALAIIDDVVAILIIALLFAGGVSYGGFVIAAGGAAAVLALQRMRVGSALGYVLPGAVVWYGLLRAGVHPTLAGVVLGLMTPVVRIGRRQEPPVSRVQSALHPWVAYGVMPLFAFANAGVSLQGAGLSLAEPMLITAAVAVALFVGKPLGVFGATWLAVRFGWGRLPVSVSWGWVCLIGLLAGVGFTMSIFIATLAFTDETILSAAKLGVLIGSTLAGMSGLAWGATYMRSIARSRRGT